MKNQFEELQQQTELLKQQLNIKSKQIEELRCHHVSKDSLILESQTQTPEELKRETEQKTELFEKCHHLESQINELRQNLLSAENIINLKEKEIEELKSVVTTIKTQLKLRDDEIALLRSEQANPMPPSDELKNEIHSEAKEHKQFDGCLQKLANDLDERNRQLQEMSQAYEEEKRRRQIVENEIQNAGQEKLKWIQTKTKLKGKLNDATQKLSALVVENQKLVESIQRLTQQSQNETESLQKIIEQQQHAIDELQCKLRQEEEKCQFLQSRIESFENVSFASSQSLATPTKEAASDLNKKQNDSHYMIETQTEVIERLQQRITELEKFAEIKEESLKECNVKLKTLQEALNEKKDQIVALQNSNEANVCKLQSLQHELDQARQRIQELNDTLVAQDNDSTPKKAQEVTNVDSHNVIALQETIAKQQSEISQLREKIRGLKQLLLKAHQHISDSNKTVAETKEQLQIAKQENVELQQKIAKMERQQNQNVDELVRIKAQEEIERRLSQLVKVHREKEIAFESEIQSLKDKLKEVEEEFRGYRARAQLAMSSNKEGVEQRGDGTLLSPSESEDDITRKLRQKLSETKRTLISLSGVQEELQKTKLELQRKSEELEQMQKRHLELVTKCNDLNLQLEQEQQKFKDKKRRYRDTLKLIDEKHAKGIPISVFIRNEISES
jgi:chromosome segregation ATPase